MKEQYNAGAKSLTHGTPRIATFGNQQEVATLFWFPNTLPPGQARVKSSTPFGLAPMVATFGKQPK